MCFYGIYKIIKISCSHSWFPQVKFCCHCFMVTETCFTLIVPIIFQKLQKWNLKVVCPDSIVTPRSVKDVVIQDWSVLGTVGVGWVTISSFVWDQPGLQFLEELSIELTMTLFISA